MNILPYNDSMRLDKIRSLSRLLYASAVIALLLVTTCGLFLTSNSIIGSSAYSDIRRNSDAVELITLINSGLYQITNEINLLARDGDRGADNIQALVNAMDDRFNSLSALLKAHDRRETVIKAEAAWKEYRKTLLGEILPAAARENILKVTYLLTGIQSQRQYSINRSFSSLSQQLRQEVRLSELGAKPSDRLKTLIIAISVSILLALTAVFYLILRACRTKQPHENSADDSSISDTAAHAQVQTADSSAPPGPLNEIAENMRLYASQATAATPGDEFQLCAPIASMHSSPFSTESRLEPGLRQLAAQSAILLSSLESLDNDIVNLSRYAPEKAVSSLQIAAGIDELAFNSDKACDMAKDICHIISELKISCKSLELPVNSLPPAITSGGTPVDEENCIAKEFLNSRGYVEQLSCLVLQLDNLLMHIRSSAHRYNNYAALTAEASVNTLDTSGQIEKSRSILNRSCGELSDTINLIMEKFDPKTDQLAILNSECHECDTRAHNA